MVPSVGSLRFAYFLLLFAIPALHADVTLRYKAEIKLNPSLPEEVAQQALKGMGASVPPETSFQLKNGKAFASSGAGASICDFAKQEITLIDRQGKRYATLPAGKLADAMAHAMPAASDDDDDDDDDGTGAAMAAMKGHFDVKPVSRSAIIQGVEAEEHEFVMTIDAPAVSDKPEGVMVRVVMHLWMAKAAEAARVPAVGELARYNLFGIATMNPLATAEKMLQQMPGFTDNMAAMRKELQTGTSVLLRMRIEMFMPMLGAMIRQMPAETRASGTALDPNAPIMEMNMEVAGISTAPVADSLFRIPPGYRSVPAAEIIKDMMAKAQAAGN